ncbi:MULTISPECIES: GNAT family N-acetyltransferase [Sphingomonas]|uniref:GNAT family N-acetyltransferase n=1 Tax=Sphingomonas TaxID=13687 RepID=UPI000DEEE44C|nr:MULTISPECIES: GNAT family N-acetyltransferase [Sphingomonas]
MAVGGDALAALLDRPIYAALTSRQAGFALGAPPALRFRPEVEPFIAAADDSPAALAALAALCAPGEQLVLLQAAASKLPPDLIELSCRPAVQMIAIDAPASSPPDGARPLGEADAPDMQALAELTAPGPFRAETWRLGGFWGVRDGGRLIAMAGERLAVPGAAELSGVCTHPDARGRGLARALSTWKLHDIARRGEQVFLHAYVDNAPAVALYCDLGFTVRATMTAQVVALAPDDHRG